MDLMTYESEMSIRVCTALEYDAFLYEQRWENLK